MRARRSCSPSIGTAETFYSWLPVVIDPAATYVIGLTGISGKVEGPDCSAALVPTILGHDLSAAVVVADLLIGTGAVHKITP